MLLLAAAAVLLATFSVIELLVASAPLLPLRIVRTRAISIANLITAWSAPASDVLHRRQLAVLVALLIRFGARNVVIPGAGLVALGVRRLWRIPCNV